MNIPGDLKYSKEHEWMKIDGNTAVVGITDYAQGELGDIVFVELPNIGDTFDQMQSFATIEAVKAVSDVYAPLSGKIVEVNAALDDDPMVINKDPYGDGWMVKIELSDIGQVEKLLGAEDYQKLISE